MSSQSPMDHSGYEGGHSENEAMTLDVLKSLTEKKKGTRVDGQPLKRRGPKPDSKPALTRRQELNRQAQRTHRERKELYIKALEEEVLRLKQTFSLTTRDKESLAEENRQLRALLAQHGIPWAGTGGIDEFRQNPSYSSSGSISGSYAPPSQGFNSPPQLPVHHSSFDSTPSPLSGNGPEHSHSRPLVSGIDYDQAGIDFVLTLERPCMDHMQFLVERSNDADGEFCGHALMATCPPNVDPTADPEMPFGHGIHNGDGEGYKLAGGQKTWDINKGDLANLLDLSKRLNLDGEITPVMAWGLVLADLRFYHMTLRDFQHITDELKEKSRCYGFGAVLEEFEVRDAIESCFYLKPDSNQSSAAAQS